MIEAIADGEPTCLIRKNHYVVLPRIVTTGGDGVQRQWTLSGTVEQKLEEHSEWVREQNRDQAERHGGTWYESTQCEWPVQSDWSHGQCNRSAGPTPDGMALCWQHQDSAFSHVLGRIRRGHCTSDQLESLADAMLPAHESGADCRKGRSIQSLIESRTREYIQKLSSDSWIEPGISDALDALIEKRLQSQWANFSDGDEE